MHHFLNEPTFPHMLRLMVDLENKWVLITGLLPSSLQNKYIQGQSNQHCQNIIKHYFKLPRSILPLFVRASCTCRRSWRSALRICKRKDTQKKKKRVRERKIKIQGSNWCCLTDILPHELNNDIYNTNHLQWAFSAVRMGSLHCRRANGK